MIKKGVEYFKTYNAANVICRNLIATYPEARVVYYGLGHAVQYELSGAYYPEKEVSK